MNSRTSGVVVRVLACAVGLCGVLSLLSSSLATKSDTLTIGVVLPLTGEAAHWGVAARRGAELAVDGLNAAGGIGGRQVALMVEDDRCQAGDGIAAFNRIMAAARPPAVLGAVCSGVTLAIAPLAEQQRTVLISPASTSPKLSEAGDFIFRVIPSGALRGKVLADYLYHDRGLRRLAVLYINNEGGAGGGSAFKAHFTQLGGKVVFEESYPQGASDLRAQLTRMKAANAQGVLVGSYPPDTIVILRQARELAVQLPMFFTTEAVENTDVLRQAGAAAEGVVYILAASASGPAPAAFAQAHAAKYGKPPEPFAAEGYDVVRLIAAAATGAGTPLGGAGIRDFLHSVHDYAGASGTITFDSNGDVIKPYAIKTIDAGSPRIMVVR
jgi:branched-chain amino acid transport system substrate-binding protein